MSAPLVVVDADVLGRQRTGDETYVAELLAALGRAPEGLRIAAVTRHPELVPPGIEPVELQARSQILRMSVSVSALLRGLRPALVHFLHALPLRCPCPGVVTICDLSFELAPRLMPRRDRVVFKLAVPWSVRRAARVVAISERTRRDLAAAYGLDPESIAVVPPGVHPRFRPEAGPRGGFALFVGAVQERKNPLAAAAAAAEVGLPLLVVGPRKDEALAAELERRGARLLGHVGQARLAELYREAECLVFPSRFEGFGLPLLEAMASGTPAVCVDEPALREVAGAAAVFVPAERLGDGIRRALAERDELVHAGLARARRFSWEEAARRTLAVYRDALGRATDSRGTG